MTEYGTPDSDPSTYQFLLELVGERPVDYVMHHQRVPDGARPCQRPGSLTVAAVLTNGVVVRAIQLKPGEKPKQG